MIVGLNGTIIKKEMTLLHLDVQGVVYKVFISLHCYSLIKDSHITLHTTHIIREDSWQLYGFVDTHEQKLFETLIKINGVGPKVAMAICSTFTPQHFASITQTKNATALTSVPGIGPKSANRIMVELSSFTLEMTQEHSPKTLALQEATQALESLGFKQEVISKVLSQCTATTTSHLIKEALSHLNK
jgi:holliday junction DNA helicase RuvA